MEKIVIIAVVLSVISVGFLSGCNEKSSVSEENEIEYVDAALNTLGLELDDLLGDFEVGQEDYVTEPYYIESGFFEGTRVLERYNVTFIESDYSIVEQFLVRYESKEKCKSVLVRL